MGWRTVLVVAALFAADPPKTPDEAGALVDRVVAMVEGTPVTASSVALEAAIREQIASSPDKAEFGRLLTDPVDPLEAVVFRTILLSRPEIRAIRPSGFAAERRLRLFEETFADRGDAVAWRVDWGLDKAVLLDFFKQSVVLDRIVDLAVVVDVTEEAERTYYERHKDAVYGGRPFEEVRDDVTRRVHNLEFEEAYNAWRTAVRSSAELRYVVR